tara:strand:- start:118 stop:1308 length:1191 start_codon:yes stop_codon:yes gene_type:complete
MKLKTLDEINFDGKVVLLRCDLNVPIDNEGKVSDKTKIKRHKGTINELIAKKAKIIIISHLGRPKGKLVKELSMNRILHAFAEELKIPEVTVLPYCGLDIMKKVFDNMDKGTITFLENIRFYPEEEKNDLAFAKKLAEISDIYINDAFSVSHRKHISTYGLSKFLPSFVGRSLQLELEMLEKINNNINKPVMAIIGGSKISTKINLLENLIKKVNFLAIGGAMANTFLLAKGHEIGNSLVERKKIETATIILDAAKNNDCDVILPLDVVTSERLDSENHFRVSLDEIDPKHSIFDIGEKTIEKISNTMAICKTIFWNGPLGVYEKKPFDNSTNIIGRTAAILTKAKIITSVAGGGDTVAALNSAELSGGFSYVSIAGGALVEWLEGKELPGLEFLS